MVKGPGNLTVTTPSDLEIEMKREFNAPRELVFDAMTRPELLQRWHLGPDGWTLPVCEVDLRVGGAYHYVWHGPDGEVMGVNGDFREVVPPERIVHTERFDEAWYEGEALVTVELTEQQGRTTLTMTMRFTSKEGRDMALASGMEYGVDAGFARLEALLASDAV